MVKIKPLFVTLFCCLFSFSCNGQVDTEMYYENLKNLAYPGLLSRLHVAKVPIHSLHLTIEQDSGVMITPESEMFELITSLNLVNGSNNFGHADSVFTKDSGWIPYPTQSKEDLLAAYKNSNPKIFILKKIAISNAFETILFKVMVDSDFQHSKQWFVLNYNDSRLLSVIIVASIFSVERDIIKLTSRICDGDYLCIKKTGLKLQKLKILESGMVIQAN